MAKNGITLSIDEKRNALNEKIEMLNTVETVVEAIKRCMDWECRFPKYDPETGETILDDEGNAVYEIVNEDSYNRYTQCIAAVMSLI